MVPAGKPSKSSRAVAGYQRSSIPNSLDGAHKRLIANSAATRDQGTSAASASRRASQKRSSPSRFHSFRPRKQFPNCRTRSRRIFFTQTCATRSEEHTSELQSQSNLVCRLLLEKKKKEEYTTS